MSETTSTTIPIPSADDPSAPGEVDFAYECPDCGEGHDGMTTGTELCPDCENEAVAR